jgi:hypothetical protein
MEALGDIFIFFFHGLFAGLDVEQQRLDCTEEDA